MPVAASEYPFADLMWTFVLFFGLMIFFWLLITVFGDLFRRRDIGGWGKAAWTVFVLLLPMIGTLVYLISQHGRIGERDRLQADAIRESNDEYIRSVTGTGRSGADEIAHGKQLLDEGAITADEFAQLKRRVLV
jgi:Phospholipase_D-nuclease N-terminal